MKHMPKQEKTTKGGSKKMAIGAGIAALTAAAVAYLLVGPQGKRNRKVLKGWVIKMKGEIVEKLENVKDITEPVFHRIVDEVAGKYEKIKNISPADLEEAVKEIKRQWKTLAKESKNSTNGKKSSSKKAAA
ncbi:MAG TPA: hypothetical protein PK295_04140 [Candidatus Magasanikbacteria bacterium]|nr:hypothetical protein [Candidatus Magasanikbacteria bacterium]